MGIAGLFLFMNNLYQNNPKGLKPDQHHERLSTTGKILKMVLRPIFKLTPRQICIVILHAYCGMSFRSIGSSNIKIPKDAGDVCRIYHEAMARVRES